jgi:sugar diacid utilization regulator
LHTASLCYYPPETIFILNSSADIFIRPSQECSKNATLAAEQLFIHRNTLNYRIKKIEELTGLGLDNHNVVQCLMDSFRIETLLNLKKGK